MSLNLCRRICFCTADREHDKVFAYIARNHENETMECHAFLCPKRKIVRVVTFFRWSHVTRRSKSSPSLTTMLARGLIDFGSMIVGAGSDAHRRRVVSDRQGSMGGGGAEQETATGRGELFNSLDARSRYTDFAQTSLRGKKSVYRRHGMLTHAPEVVIPTARCINASRQKSVYRLCVLMHTGTGMPKS